jgi:hypothetical protein
LSAILDQMCIAYLQAKKNVFAAGYGHEILSGVERGVCSIAETDFLREAAWVILSVGMRESVIRQKFEGISASFKDWSSSKLISEDAEECVRQALRQFQHVGKIGAILFLCKYMNAVGFNDWRPRAFQDPIQSFQDFPFIGPVTAFHLAKNLGFDVAKADRHLARLASHHGYASVHEFCNHIASSVGDSVTTVDTVLWRFSTLSRDSITIFDDFRSRRGKSFRNFASC